MLGGGGVAPAATGGAGTCCMGRAARRRGALTSYANVSSCRGASERDKVSQAAGSHSLKGMARNDLGMGGSDKIFLHLLALSVTHTHKGFISAGTR